MGRGTVTAYPRQLESLIRLSEAHAKMRLSNSVEELDVAEATRYVTMIQIIMPTFLFTGHPVLKYYHKTPPSSQIN